MPDVAPSRGRGLKHSCVSSRYCSSRRPFTGAWIETRPVPAHAAAAFVAPSRGRGLKPDPAGPAQDQHSVAPSRGRGLKPKLPEFLPDILGRPFTGAWIETPASRNRSRPWPVAPSRGRGLKRLQSRVQVPLPRRPFTGAWIETNALAELPAIYPRRPFTGAWIETPACRFLNPKPTSPLHGGVD